MGELRKALLSEIRPNPVALRSVDRESEAFLGLVESIRTKGFIGAITVRQNKDVETGAPYLELVDGLHRFTAASIVGIESINVDITSLDDDQVLEAQIMANVHKIETKPAEYTHQLIRIMNRNPLLTISELAAKIGKTASWLEERLSLSKIKNSEIIAAINEGKIGLSNAYALAKLPEDEQIQYVDQAITKKPAEFIPVVKARVKEINEAKRKGKEATASEFTAVEFMQKLGDIKEARTNGTAAAVCASEGATTAAEGFVAALNWVLHVHKDGIAEQKAKDEARKLEQAEAAKRRAEEKEKKKAASAADAAARAVERQAKL